MKNIFFAKAISREDKTGYLIADYINLAKLPSSKVQFSGGRHPLNNPLS